MDKGEMAKGRSGIKVGNDESYFNVSLIAKDNKVRRQCPQTTIFEDKGEPNRFRLEQ